MVSLDDNGFTLNFSVATAGRIACLAIGQLGMPSITDETVEIGENLRLVKRFPEILNETIDIAETLVTQRTKIVIVNETIEIGEAAPVVVRTDIGLQDRIGTTLQPHALQGITLQDIGAVGTQTEASVQRYTILQPSAARGTTLQPSTVIAKTLQ